MSKHGLKQFVFLLVLFVSPGAYPKDPDFCSDRGTQFIPVDDPNGQFAKGQYMRVHPKGEYLIFTVGYNAHLVDLKNRTPDGKAKIIETPLKNEAYPVEGTWRLISSYNERKEGVPGMGYYLFKDLIQEQTKSKMIHFDAKHNQYYQSCAELPDSNENEVHFRTLLWSPSSKDYRVKLNKDGSVESVVEEGSRSLCSNLGRIRSTPILSKDATEIASNLATLDGSSDNTLKIFKINSDGTCTLDEDLQVGASKASFSYPLNGKKGRIAFMSADRRAEQAGLPGQAIFVYDRDAKKMKRVSLPWIDTAVSYPGFTKDGLVIYKAKRNGVAGVVVVNPDKVAEVPAMSGSDAIDDPYRLCAEGAAGRTPAPSPTGTGTR